MSETFCYEIYLKFEHNDKIGRIGLPIELKPRFKTLDPNPPSSEFISSLMSDSEIRAATEMIVNNASVFPGDPRADQVKKTIREALEGNHYSVEVEPINCEFDNIFGDPDNEDKPYPSVDDTAPPVTNQPNTDAANADNKCYVATFTIQTVSGLDSVNINVSLQSSSSPLPDPISTDNPTIDSIKTYVAAIDQKVADSITLPAGHSIWGVSWNGEFWKLKSGNGACADEDDPDPAPVVDDPDTPDEDESEPLISIKTTRPSDIKLINGQPVDGSDVEYTMELKNESILFDEGVINKIISDFTKKSTTTKKSIIRPTTKDENFFTNLNITPKNGDLSVFEKGVVNQWYKPDSSTFELFYIVNLGSSRVVPQQLADKIPTAINIRLSLDINLQFSGEIIVDWASPHFTAYTQSDGNDFDRDETGTAIQITLEKFKPDNPREKGKDFESCSGVIQYEHVTDHFHNMQNNQYNSTALKTITADINITTDPFVIEIPRIPIQTNVIFFDTLSGNVKYKVKYNKNLTKIIQDQFAVAIKNHVFKIQQAIEQKYSLDPEKDSDFLNKAVDGYRGILLQKGQEKVPKDKHKCAILVHEYAKIDLVLNNDLSKTSISLIDPENNKPLK